MIREAKANRNHIAGRSDTATATDKGDRGLVVKHVKARKSKAWCNSVYDTVLF